MAAKKILRLERATEPTFETANAKTSAHRLHARSLPHRIANHIDLRIAADALLDALTCIPLLPECHDGLFHFSPVEDTRGSVDAAVDAEPTFGN